MLGNMLAIQPPVARLMRDVFVTHPIVNHSVPTLDAQLADDRGVIRSVIQQPDLPKGATPEDVTAALTEGPPTCPKIRTLKEGQTGTETVLTLFKNKSGNYDRLQGVVRHRGASAQDTPIPTIIPTIFVTLLTMSAPASVLEDIRQLGLHMFTNRWQIASGPQQRGDGLYDTRYSFDIALPVAMTTSDATSTEKKPRDDVGKLARQKLAHAALTKSFLG